MAERDENGELLRRLRDVEEQLRQLSIARTARDPDALARRESLDSEQADLREKLGLAPSQPERTSSGGNTGWVMLAGACIIIVAVLTVLNL